MFRHPDRGVWTLVHGDDYCSAGYPGELDWLENVLSKRYDVTTQRIGDGNQRNGEPKAREGQVLNRVIRRTGSGWELEADLRHAELIVQQLGLGDGKTAATPVVDMPETSVVDEEEEEETLAPEQATVYMAIGSRCNYLAPDRPDLQYATKEACRRMAKPTPHAWEMLTRIGRYLKGNPRLVWHYDGQAPQDTIDVTSDAD